MKVVYYIVFFAVLLEVGVGLVKTVRGQSDNAWTGGNGCNLVGGQKYKACCTNHDRNYKAGGYIGARWDADAELFKCVWKRDKPGKFMAPLFWVATRVIGPFAFQWGKKKEIKDVEPPPETKAVPEE